MILYLDTSSIVKLYVEEAGSDDVRQRARSTSRLASSMVAYAEVRAALAAAVRQGRHTRNEHAVAISLFERMWIQMTAVHADESLVHAAGDLADRYELRGFDAIHLSSALSLYEELGEPVTFWSFDERLNAAAAAAGLTLA